MFDELELDELEPPPLVYESRQPHEVRPKPARRPVPGDTPTGGGVVSSGPVRDEPADLPPDDPGEVDPPWMAWGKTREDD